MVKNQIFSWLIETNQSKILKIWWIPNLFWHFLQQVSLWGLLNLQINSHPTFLFPSKTSKEYSNIKSRHLIKYADIFRYNSGFLRMMHFNQFYNFWKHTVVEKNKKQLDGKKRQQNKQKSNLQTISVSITGLVSIFCMI